MLDGFGGILQGDGYGGISALLAGGDGPNERDAKGHTPDERLRLRVDIALGPHDIVRPDLAGWHREHLPRPGNVRPIETGPDWVCEVLSPSTAARDRVTKRHLYARAETARE